MRVPRGSCVVRADGVIAEVTDSFLAMIGRERREVVGKKVFSDLIVGSQDGKIFDILRLDARRNGPVENVDLRLKRSDGSTFPASVDVRSSDGAAARQASVDVAVEDVSYIREREERLSRSRDAYFNMLKDLHASLKETRQLLEELIYALANAIDAKSHWTMGHSRRVSEYALAIAGEMGVEEADVADLKTAALLHDIGKIGTYDDILDKPQDLTAGEYELVKAHPLKGVRILEPIKKMGKLLPIIIHHHEKVDGTGYPYGLKGDEIPLPARILSVADAYDSMRTRRPYREPMGEDHAVGELRRLSGSQFDREVVAAFLRVLGKAV